MLSPAKFNLTLEALSKREDGYHNIKSVFMPVDLFDYVEVKATTKKDIVINCNNQLVPTDKTNIAYEVLDYLRKKHDVKKGFEVTIEKNIPMQSGLGGGSSNGATVARWFQETYDIDLDLEELSKISADIPFFILGRTALVSGIGENVKLLKNTLQFKATIIKANKGACTTEMYKKVKLTNGSITQSVIDALDKDNALEAFEKAHNCFEDNYKKEIKDLLLCGFNKVMVSGSGSAFICIGDINLDIWKIMEKKYEMVGEYTIG